QEGSPTAWQQHPTHYFFVFKVLDTPAKTETLSIGSGVVMR
ncbi:131_t:CDS:2, partial [Funneliformis mosseae]